MSEADAKSSFHLEFDQFLDALSEMVAGLAKLDTDFAAVGPSVTQQLVGIDHAALQAAGSLRGMEAPGGGLLHKLVEMSHYAFLIPSSLSRMLPILNAIGGRVGAIGVGFVNAANPVLKMLTPLREGLHLVSQISTGAKILRGDFTLLDAVIGTAMGKLQGGSLAGGALKNLGSLAVSSGASLAKGLGRGISSSLGGALSGMGGLSAGLMPLMAAAGPLAAVAGSIGLVGASVRKAASMQDLSVTFETLLGSADAARERLGELADFAAATPFELPEVANASKVLQTLTGGALATGQGLTTVGDVAAATGQPFGDMAVTIGRLYEGLQSGRPVGEAMSRLQELGAMSGSTRTQIEELQKSGAKGDEVWKIAAAALGRFSGEMAARSGTWTGLMSTLSDEIGGLMREFGMPVLDALTPVLKGMIALMHQLAPMAKHIGEIFAGILKKMTAILGFNPVVPSERGKLDPAAQKQALLGGGENVREKKPEIKVGHMRELGGGGAFHLGLGGKNAELLDLRRANALLERIATNTAGGKKEAHSGNYMPVPVAL